jgi:outer membrane protein insertion porin family
MKLAKRKNWYFVILLSVVLIPFTAFGSESQTIIKQIEIIGNKKVKTNEILTALKLKPDMPLPESFTEQFLALDHLGAFSEMSVEVTEIPEGGVIVTFRVKEKPTIENILLHGNRALSSEELLSELGLKRNDFFDNYRLQDGMDKIIHLYKEKGYLFASGNWEKAEKEDLVVINIYLQEGNKIDIQEIILEGVKVFSPDQIRGTMKTKVKPQYLLVSGGLYREEDFQQDLKTIVEFYKNRGYPHARIVNYQFTYDSEIDLEKKEMYIRIVVEEGPHFRWSAVEVSGNREEVMPTVEILRLLDIPRGSLYQQDKLEKGILNVQEGYYEKGYLYLDISHQIYFNEQKGEAILHLEISEGEQARIGKIIIQGNIAAKEYVIRREFLLSEGDIFCLSKYQRSLQKIYNLGFFKNVTPQLQPDFQTGQINILITVEEQGTGSIMFTTTYSELEKFSGGLEWAQNNLSGNGQSLSIQAESGGLITTYQIRFTEPWFLNTPTRLGLEIYDTRRDYQQYYYKERRQGASLSMGRPLNEVTEISGTYRYELIDIYDVGSGASPEIIAQQGLHITSSLTGYWARDNRDNIFLPTRGSRQYISLTYAGGILGGDSNFVKMLGGIGWYQKSWWKSVRSLSLQIGIASGIEGTDVPPYERFYVGGATTVRGYPERALSPSTGGRLKLVLNAEYSFPLVEKTLNLVFFADAGRAWEYPYNFNLQDIGSSIGVELRFLIWVFPLRWGMGYSFQDQKWRTYFTLGPIF